MDRPSGSFIIDPDTGALSPNLDDDAMAARHEKAPDQTDPTDRKKKKTQSTDSEEVTTHVEE